MAKGECRRNGILHHGGLAVKMQELAESGLGRIMQVVSAVRVPGLDHGMTLVFSGALREKARFNSKGWSRDGMSEPALAAFRAG